MDTMLRTALRKYRELRTQFENCLLGEEGDIWEAEAKNFLAKRPCWVKDQSCNVTVTPVTTSRFGPITEFPIMVPADYDHATCLARFRTQNKKKFYYWNDDLTDEHFANPTRILKPGDRFLVKVFAQTVSGSTTSVERLDFVKSQGGILVGAQGVPLVWEQQRDRLEKGFWYSSFDEKDRLWEDAAHRLRVPDLTALSDGDWKAHLGDFGYDWLADGRLLCFCEIK